MNYAIIRNSKYTYDQLNLVYRHNERKNTNYSNKDIRLDSRENYSIKKCNAPYTKKLRQAIQENDLKGRIKKTSNVACEYIITASPEFFDNKSKEEIRRYFENAYKFVCGFKSLGEENIISAKVHMDESTPHMHLVFIPVVHKDDTKSGKTISKLCCSDFWKGRNSYRVLQDNYFKYMVKAGFDLDRGDTKENEHLKISDLKRITNYEMQKYEKEMQEFENEFSKDIDDIKDDEKLRTEYKKIIRKYNTIATKFTRLKTISKTTLDKVREVEEESKIIKKENEELKNNIFNLKHYVRKTFECVSLLFDMPIDRLKRIVSKFVREGVKNESNIERDINE